MPRCYLSPVQVIICNLPAHPRAMKHLIGNAAADAPQRCGCGCGLSARPGRSDSGHTFGAAGSCMLRRLWAVSKGSRPRSCRSSGSAPAGAASPPGSVHPCCSAWAARGLASPARALAKAVRTWASSSLSCWASGTLQGVEERLKHRFRHSTPAHLLQQLAAAQRGCQRGLLGQVNMQGAETCCVQLLQVHDSALT